MEKNIKDYLHLYIGCEVMIETNGEEGFKAVLKGVCESEVEPGKTIAIIDNSYDEGYAFHEFFIEDAKPLLRPLSEMTVNEGRELDNIQRLSKKQGRLLLTNTNGWEVIQSGAPEGFRFLLNRGFDLFGLIEAGLAIDKTKVA